MLYNMKDVLHIAQAKQFALPAFNISSLPMLIAVIETAEEMNAPVILEVHPEELTFVTPAFMETMKKFAVDAHVPVVLHLDHGSSFEDIKKAIACGFTSVMIDGSLLPFEENIALTCNVVHYAQGYNVSVEAELGTIGTTGTSMEGGNTNIVYTDVQQAISFVEQTHIDSLAVAIGTAHGIYPKDVAPELQIALLKEIRGHITIPLVLHGGSSNRDVEIEQCVLDGICKVNISSDIKSVFFATLRNVVREHDHWYEPNQIYPPCMEKVKEVVAHKIRLLHAEGKAILYR